jgi:hypothetical protein
MLKTLFWQRAAQSLPSVARRRHTKHFERAERIERAVSAVVDFWRRCERRVHAQPSR